MTIPGDGVFRRIRVLLADDHAEFLEGIRQLLESEFEIAASVSNGRSLIETTAVLRPDVVISDVNMPELNGIEAGNFVIQNGLCNAVILLSMYNDPHLIRRALQAGIRGYVLKVDAGEELVAAVSTVIAGESYISREVLAGWKEDYAEDPGSPRG